MMAKQPLGIDERGTIELLLDGFLEAPLNFHENYEDQSS